MTKEEFINAFVRTLNNLTFDGFSESDHPRDDDGKFTDTGEGSGGESEKKGETAGISVKGDELGEYKDIKELRQKAKEYYKQHFQGRTVHKEGLGDIRFSKTGIDETISHSNEDKLKLVPFIKEIILNGEAGEEEDPKHPRKDGIVKFIPIKTTVKLNDKSRAVEVLIGKDDRGKLYYDLFTDNIRYKKVTLDRSLEQNPEPSRATSRDNIPSAALTVNIFFEDEEDDLTQDNNLAFDRRYKDDNGYLHVSASNLTKEQVTMYFGHEIPLEGLEPLKAYKVYRPAAELKKASDTFNGIPVLIRHKTDSADNPQKMLRVGVTGTEAAFDGRYLKNSLIFHDTAAIELIESGEQRELSAGYKYKPIAEKGMFNGQDYDIRMTDIVANHIAIVREGRAGSDVYVSDEKPKSKPKEGGKTDMGEKLEQIKKIFGLAADSKREEVTKKLAEAFDEKGKDVTLDDLYGDLDTALAPLIEGHKAEGEAISGIISKIRNFKAPAADAEAKPEPETKPEEKPEEKEDDKKAEDKKPAAPVFDEAAFEKRLEAKFKAKEAAAEAVFPLVGRVSSLTFDSAEDIYAFALKEAGIDTKGYQASSYKGMVDVLKAAGGNVIKLPITISAQDVKLSPEDSLIKGDLSRFKVQ